ncbi:MAG: hypothetical protein ABJL67_15770 [Sulfitobacter sp.]
MTPTPHDIEVAVDHLFEAIARLTGDQPEGEVRNHADEIAKIIKQMDFNDESG